MIARHLLPFLALFSIGSAAHAQDRDLPYWASISADTANMRVGAGERYPISWVYTRRGLPVKVIRFHQGWRLVRDPDGTEGWISAGLLSRKRMAIVTGEGLAAMREGGAVAARLKWNLEPGVIGEIGDCIEGWCQLDVEGHRGWVEAARLWGDGEP